MRGLSKRQQEVYDYIVSHVETAGFQPSVREMAQHFQIVPSAVEGHLQLLQKKGLLALSGHSRALRLNGLRFRRWSESG